MKIGLVVRLAEFPETGTAPSYTEIRETALKAEEGGFDSIWRPAQALGAGKTPAKRPGD
jgi:alkanesulfonate monooxygenase SsuD/methylene tetrahydromethanopterin reductase-like flavin-dependent oxidoreductase (luciferase family)